jgi:hypothetical protein
MPNRPDAVWKFEYGTPTPIGYNTIGQYQANIVNSIYASLFTAVEDDTATSINVYLNASASATVSGMIYDSNFNLVAATTALALSASTGWQTLVFPTPVSITPGNYWLAVWGTSAGTVMCYYDNSATPQYANQSATYSAMPPATLNPALYTHVLSIYLMISNYSDLSNFVSTNAPFNFIEDPEDTFYIGFSRRFTGIMCDLTTNGSYTGVTYQYLSTSTTWKNLQAIDSYNFSISKYQRWNLPPDWARVGFSSNFPQMASPPDGTERYWIKINVTGATTQAVISLMKVIPFVQYTTPDLVSNFLITKKPFDLTTRPSTMAVEEMIRRAEDRIDYRTKKSWRFNAVTEQTDPVYVDFSRSGMFLRHPNFYRIYAVQLWTGSSWQQLVEGRQNDYQVDYNLGFIYLTRLFSLPSIYGISGRYNQYDIGEMKNAIQVDYVYGRDLETDPEFYMVEDLATKMVAVDLLRHSDYSILTVSGGDNVPLSEKIRNLEDQIEMRIDELTAVTLA